MILVGQYDSPFVRRVAISLKLLGIPYEQDTRSVFGDFDAMRTVNPLGRIPSLQLDDGVTLIDSFAILDWLDEQTGPERALTPQSGVARRDALQVIALASGTIEKFGAVNYERLIRPSPLRWPDWVTRCETQALGGLAALEERDWNADGAFGQAQITTGCLLGYLALTLPDLLASGAYPKLAAFWARCEAVPAFHETRTEGEYGVPRGD